MNKQDRVGGEEGRIKFFEISLYLSPIFMITTGAWIIFRIRKLHTQEPQKVDQRHYLILLLWLVALFWVQLINKVSI